MKQVHQERPRISANVVQHMLSEIVMQPQITCSMVNLRRTPPPCNSGIIGI